jgi:hypothetical protein
VLLLQSKQPKEQTMAYEIYTSLLNRANTGAELLRILDVIIEDITQENINSCAAIFEVS